MENIKINRIPVPKIMVELSQALTDGIEEMSKDELTFLLFRQTDDRFFEGIKLAVGILEQHEPPFDDVINLLRSLLPTIN